MQVVMGLSMLLAAEGRGQLTPDRSYYGIDRAMPFTVNVPDKSTDEVRIDLFEPGKVDAEGKPQPVASAAALAGPVDMAALFAVLWTDQTPQVRYAQLVVGGKQVGPPVVLQPLVTPARALLLHAQTHQPWFINPFTKAQNFDPAQGEIRWITEPPVYSGMRAYVDRHAVLETSLGKIELRLRPDCAPNTVWNFLELAKGGFYTGIIFHRVVARLSSGAPFVVQVGDPTGTGLGGPGFVFDLEQSKLEHDFGVVSMARAADPNSNNSQFFICLSREGTTSLDGKYTTFAQAVSGADVIQQIARVPVNGERPLAPPVLNSVTLIDAPPYGDAPPPVARPQDSGPRER